MPAFSADSSASRTMLLDDDIPALESIDPRETLGFEDRLTALEASLDELASGQDTRLLLERIKNLEDALARQQVERRRELSTEAAARHEQIAMLATKLSRFIDSLRLPS